jgi:hypothetical protein
MSWRRTCVISLLRRPKSAFPFFPDRAVNIADHGAVPGGETMNSAAFASAIEVCAEAGGGRVLVPPNIDTVLSVAGASSCDIRLTGIDLGGRKNAIASGAGVKPDAVVVK